MTRRVSVKKLTPVALWLFYRGRGAKIKSLGFLAQCRLTVKVWSTTFFCLQRQIQDSEGCSSGDLGMGGVPPAGSRAAPLVGVGAKPRKRGSGARPQKLSSFAYPVVNFAANFASCTRTCRIKGAAPESSRIQLKTWVRKVT